MSTGRPGRRRRLPFDERVAAEHEQMRAELAKAIRGIDIHPPDDTALAASRETRVAQLRRRSFAREDDRIGTITLVDEDGVLRWEQASVVSSFSRSPRRRRRSAGRDGRGTVVQQLRFENLEKSDVGRFLGTLDHRINPTLDDDPAGNLRVVSPRLGPGRVVRPTPTGRILLLLHGTFSHSANLLGAIAATEAGARFLAEASRRYDQVLCFDHPTLQVGPIMNAVDLERVLGGSRATVDVLCHSRGGLVARWWAEALARDPQRVGKVVFVGSPLAGTSLAAPPKIRRSMELLSNVVNVLRAASGLAQQVAPLMIVVTGLLRVLSSMTRVAAKTPLTDATIAIVPGLVGMSRVGDNPEVLRLRRGAIPLAKYHAVVSDFEPEGVGWKFWRYFTNDPLYRVADLGADFVFGGANDLVVDTESMRDLADARANAGSVVPAGRTVEFGKNPNVHHLNYFAQPGTLEFLTRTFASRG